MRRLSKGESKECRLEEGLCLEVQPLQLDPEGKDCPVKKAATFTAEKGEKKRPDPTLVEVCEPLQGISPRRGRGVS